jgi:phage terminase Nu1 subunit (DNA packaging protein)
MSKDKIIQDAAGKLMGWKLPDDFYPDCFITFDATKAKYHGSWPTGTNLLHVGQAADMLEYCIGDALRAALAERDAEIAKWKQVHEVNADTLNAMQYEIDAAKTEIATLRAAARAEIEKLRSALNLISMSETSYALADFAREALKDSK